MGTEANITFRGGSPRVESDVEGPFDATEGTPEEIQDAIRRRLERLPRGLRPGEGEGEIVLPEDGAAPPPPPPTGVNLVPTAPPSDIFRQPTEPTDALPPEEEPPTGLVSRGSASGTASISVRAAALQGAAPAVVTAAATTGNAATSPAVRLWLTPGRLSVAPGDTFEVKVQAEAGRPVSHLPLSLSFDPAVLAVEKVDAGEFLGGSGESRVMSDFGRPGALVIGASRLGQVPGVKGTGTLARITFRALGVGSSELVFDGKALDAGLKPLAVRTRPARVDVQGEPTPRPGQPGQPDREGSVTGRR